MSGREPPTVSATCYVSTMQTVLACIDLSANSAAVVACARKLTHPSGELVLLHVAAPDPDFVGYDVGPPTVRDQVAKELRAEHRSVQALAATLSLGPLRVTPLTVQGVVVQRVLEHAERLGAELIVVGSRGRSALAELISGSTVHGLLRAATVPVVVVPLSTTDRE
jgi:nucleotide-binding universal stress UspA family protein